MRLPTITQTTYINEDVEMCISDLKFTLSHFSNAAKEHAERKELVTFAYVRHTVYDPVFAQTQVAITTIKQLLHPGSSIMGAKEKEESVTKQSHAFSLTIADKQKKKEEKVREREQLNINTHKMLSKRIIGIGCIAVAITDIVISVGNLRQVYPPLIALGISLAFGLTVVSAHFVIAAWLQKAPSPKQYRYRMIGVLVTGAVFFHLISSIRGSAASHSIQISQDTYQQIPAASINPLPLALTSFMLFAITLIASLRFRHSSQDDLNEKKYQELSREITYLERHIADLTRKKTEMEQSVQDEKQMARKVFEYCRTSIEACKQLARQAVVNYKQEYLRRSHSNQVPGFFSDEPDFQFDEEFQFFQPKPHTT